MAFYAGLEADNTKAYWTARAEAYERDVRAPVAALLASLPHGPWHVFRPHRDVRFSNDKSPYKTMHGAVSETEGGAIHYLHVSADGLLAAVGMYAMQRDQLARFRAAVADEVAGPPLERVVARLRRADVVVGTGQGEPLSTAPRGYDRDHPRIELLRWKGCVASTEFDDPAVLGSSRLRDELVAFWRRCDPLRTWLEEHVGPSTEAPQDRRPAGRL